jgi:DNA-binding SARP family transcriptional activator
MPGGKPRALLAVLLARAGQVVPLTRILEALWGDRPPRTCLNSLHVYIHTLRRLVPSGRVRISFEGFGYQLLVEDGQVDLLRFESLAKTGRDTLWQGDPQRAGDLLDAALAQWTGPAFEGMSDVDFLAREADLLAERRLLTQQHRIDAALGAGHLVEAAERLEALVVEHPMRERLRGQQMLAYARSGRQMDALAVFGETRQLLSRELGIEPGPQLQRLQQAILRSDWTFLREATGSGGGPTTLTGTTPNLCPLPRRTVDFTGQEAALEALASALLGAVADRSAVVAVCGPAGAGKSALVSEVGYQVREHFPDGQFYVDAREMEPEDALGLLLRALGVAPAQVPAGRDERLRLYRASLQDRRVLLVFDNVNGESQVRSLLPAEAGCAAVITSRPRLSGLEGAQTIEVGPLAEDEALVLLRRIAGADRVDAERHAAVQMVRACDRLPLSIRVAGARLATHPHWTLAGMAERLYDPYRCLDVLTAGDLRVRDDLEASLLALSSQERRVVRVLGLHPEPAKTARSVAGTVGMAMHTVEGILDRLAEARLIAVTATGLDAPPLYRLPHLLRMAILAQEAPPPGHT